MTDFHDRLASLCGPEINAAMRNNDTNRAADMITALATMLGRALATPDQTAALDRLIAEAVADKDAEIAQLNQDLSDMRDNAESAYRRGYWAGGNGA